MSEHILVVDDEPKITSALFVLLKSVGYEVTVLHGGQEAIQQLATLQPDLILLDVTMPGMDGFEVCRHIRQAEKYIPVLMLTARDESYEKVAGLEGGADVYMTKPFDSGELLAQIKALLRLTGRASTSKPALIVGSLTLLPEQRQILYQNQELLLTPKEFELLQFLMQHPGQVFGRQTLLRQVWGYDFPDDSRTVDTHIQRLRAKIETDPAEPKLLQTVRGFGYCLKRP
jgi:two-component system alkaline phosphatase synthesis response regulator PhoP